MQAGHAPTAKTLSMKVMSFTLSSPAVFGNAGKMGRWVLKNTPFVVNNPLNLWYKQREMPEPPKESFREWYKRVKE